MKFHHHDSGFLTDLQAGYAQKLIARWVKDCWRSLLLMVCCILVSPLSVAQQSRLADEEYARGRLGPSFAPPDVPVQEASDELARRERMKEERRMRWLKQGNQFAPDAAGGGGADGKARSRMNGLSQEERYRLRSDIREAGFSAYAPDGGRHGRPNGRDR